MLKDGIERISAYVPKLITEASGIDSFKKVRDGLRTHEDKELTASLVASIYGIFGFITPYGGRAATRDLVEDLTRNFTGNEGRPLLQKILGAGRHIPGMLLDQASIWSPIIVGIGTGSWENALFLKIATNAAVCATIDAYNPICNFFKRGFDNKALIS